MSRRSLLRALIVVAGVTLAGLLVLVWPRIWDEVQLRTGMGLPERTQPTMRIVAHRGDLDLYPEDTLEAILAAARAGADGIEFDVHRSADGTWWVIHDPVLDATTTGSGRISQLGDGVIGAAQVDGGFGFDVARHIGLKVPTLRAVLEALDGWDGDLYIDLQHRETGDASEVIAMLGGRPAAILCRDRVDIDAVARAGGSVSALARLWNDDAVAELDGWLVDAHWEATPGEVAASSLPFVTYVDEGEYGQDEDPLFRRAWSLNIEAFLTKQLAHAFELRAMLERG